MSETALRTAQPVELPREGTAEQRVLRVEHLTTEAGWMLLTAGVVGVIVPGIAGTPFLVAGIFILLPGGPQLLSRWSQRQPAQFRPLRSEADRPPPQRSGAPLPAHLNSPPETALLEQTCPVEGGRTMEQPTPPSTRSHLPWFMLSRGRILAALVAAAASPAC